MKRFIRENKLFLILSLAFAAIVLLPFFQSGIYSGYDLTFHLSRLDGIVTSIQDKQFPIAVYPYKNFGYGYGSPLFYSDIFLIIPACIRYLLKIPLVTTYKAIVFLFVWFTIFSLLYATFYFSKNKLSSIIAAIVFLFSNYYLTDIYVRCALGEIMGIAFLPLLILNIYKLLYEYKDNWISIALLFTCILNSHVITFVLSVCLFGILILINIKKIAKNKQTISCIVKATVLAVVMCSVYIFPMLEARHAQDLNISHMLPIIVRENAVGINGIFNDLILQMNFSSDIFGLKVVDKYKSIGLLVLILPFLFLFNKIKDSYYKYIKHIFLIGLLLLVLSTKLVPLDRINFLSFIQYPSRFYILCIVIFAFVISYSIRNIKNKTLICILIICIVYNLQSLYLYKAILNKSNKNYIDELSSDRDIFIDRKYATIDTEYLYFNIEEVANGEYLPYIISIDDCGNPVNYRLMGSNITYQDLTETYIDYERIGSRFIFETNFEGEQWILMPQSYYKGYKAYEVLEDGTKKELEIFNDDVSHRFGIKIPEGKHTIYTSYEGTTIQKISAVISICGYVLCFILILIKRRKSV